MDVRCHGVGDSDGCEGVSVWVTMKGVRVSWCR